jgi:tetrathionate reductase subunit B
MEVRPDGITWIKDRNQKNWAKARDACPYNNISLIDGRFIKCHYCFHRLAEGRQPACVDACLGKAKIFGDLNDPTSYVSRLLRKHKAVVLKQNAGTAPNTYYINMEEPISLWEKRIPGFRQWSPEEIERDAHFNV